VSEGTWITEYSIRIPLRPTILCINSVCGMRRSVFGILNSDMRFSIIVFPGSNCDHDAYHAVKHVMGEEAEFVWHKDSDLRGADVVILPGGFSHGDYLRTGAIARFSPVMCEVAAFASLGGPVLGVCNGFQILLESGLLPGAMLRNAGLKFRCEHVHIRVEQTDTPFTAACRRGQVLRIPIAHGEGNYFAPPDVIDRLERNRQIVFRYCEPSGEVTGAANPNGSIHGIAGLCNEQRNVVGLMPHPERACEPALGSADGRVVFESVIHSLRSGSFGLREPAARIAPA
jgi:phosphoribosylformylglycinamidine synthase subunit PurQ / glutaminase